MQYKIIFLTNSEYCSLKPSDPECHWHETVYADSKAEAVMKFHESRGMIRKLGGKCSGGKILPEIWSVE